MTRGAEGRDRHASTARGPEYATELTPVERATLERLVQAQRRSWGVPVAAALLTVLVLAGAFLLKPGRSPQPPPEPFAQLAAAAPRQPAPLPKHRLVQRTLEVTVTGTAGRCLVGSLTASIAFVADAPLDRPLDAQADLEPAAAPARLPGCDPARTKALLLDQSVQIRGDVPAQWEGLGAKWAITGQGLGLPPYTDPRMKPPGSGGDAAAWWTGLAARLASPQLDPAEAAGALRTAAARADADGVAVVPDATADLTGRPVFTVRVPGGMELAFDPATGTLRQRLTTDGAIRHFTVYLGSR